MKNVYETIGIVLLALFIVFPLVRWFIMVAVILVICLFAYRKWRKFLNEFFSSRTGTPRR